MWAELRAIPQDQVCAGNTVCTKVSPVPIQDHYYWPDIALQAEMKRLWVLEINENSSKEGKATTTTPGYLTFLCS